MKLWKKVLGVLGGGVATFFTKNVAASCDFTVGKIITSVKLFHHANVTP